MLGEKALGQLGEMRGCVFVGKKQAYELANTVCFECGDCEETKGNLILLCDGDGCNRAYHMACLNPPMQRLPWKNRNWFCPNCRGASQSKEGTPAKGSRLGQLRKTNKPKARSGTPNSDMMPSPYEQQRLDNIARNQKILESLGLG